MAVKLTQEQQLLKDYKNWSKLLNSINYENSIEDYKRHLEVGFNKPFKCISCYSIEFYVERYFLLDYSFIKDETVKRMVSSRGSSYDPVNVAKHKGISLDEAIELVNKRKFETSGSLESYIARHGEILGKQKYDEFRFKCVINKDTLIEKYGEVIGTQKWDNYTSSRDSGSINFYLKKCNNDLELATIEHNLFRKLCSDTGTKEYYTKKYGQDYVDDLNYRKGYKSTLQYFVDEYGEEDGVIKHKEFGKKKAITLDNMIEKYGEDVGRVKYLNWLEKSCPIGNNFACVSKQSINFFKLLEDKLGRKLQYGSKSKELRLQDIKDCKSYYYDCYDEESNTIIEFNGSIWHPSPLLSEEEKLIWSVGGFNNISYTESLEKDTRKINFAKSEGYDIIVVWDYDIKYKFKQDKTITNLIEVLNGKSNKNI